MYIELYTEAMKMSELNFYVKSRLIPFNGEKKNCPKGYKFLDRDAS